MARVWLICITFVLASCGPSAERGGFDSDNPAAKLYAIRLAGESRDRSAVPALVEQLDHDDPAVRMLSIHALQQISGTRMGYEPYASVTQRQAAIDRWAQAVREGTVP